MSTIQEQINALVNQLSVNDKIEKGIKEIKYNFIYNQIKEYNEVFENISHSDKKDSTVLYDKFIDTIEAETKEAIEECNRYGIDLYETENHIDNYNCMIGAYQACNRNINLLKKYL